MNRFIAALSLALGASGCFWYETGAVSASWSITVGGDAATCQEIGADTVEIVSRRLGSGTVYHDFYNCVDGSGVTADVRTGRYEITLRLFDLDGHQLNDDFPVQIEVFSDEITNAGSFEFAFDDDGGGGGPIVGKGKLKADWVVTVNGEETSCEDVGAATFEIIANENTSSGFQRTFSFPCSAFTGTSEEVPAGTYVVSVRLLDGNRAMLSSVPVNATVPVAANETKDVGDFEFAFTFRAASFRVKMGSTAMTGGNCTGTPNQGAGVIEQEIQLTSNTTQQCLSLAVSGVRDLQDQPSSTLTCTPYLCQAETTNQVLRRLNRGSYSIRVLGYKSGGGTSKAVCYVSGKIPFSVGDTDVDLGTITAAFDTSYDTQALCSVQ